MPDRFKKALARIAGDPGPAELVERPEKPESHGWLRRRDLDRAGADAWELPNGAIRLTEASPNDQRSSPPKRPSSKS